MWACPARRPIFVLVAFYLMSENAIPKRRYDASRRRRQAAATQARVIEAAARVFMEKGYAGATIPLIAAEADVALQTVYRAAPGKAGLLEAAVQAALAGGVERSRVEVDDRPAIRAIIDEPDPRRQLELYAATQPGVWGRVGPLLRVLDAAAASEPELQRLRDGHAKQRREGLGRFAALLAEHNALREGLTAERAADVIWTLCSQSNHDSLVLACGWSPRDYQDWLARTLQQALLG